MPGLELADARVGSSRRHRAPEAESLVEPGGIEGSRELGIGEEGLGLRSPEETAFRKGVLERHDAGRVARQDEFALLRVPERYRPLAVEAREAARAPFFPGVHDHLGI